MKGWERWAQKKIQPVQHFMISPHNPLGKDKWRKQFDNFLKWGDKSFLCCFHIAADKEDGQLRFKTFPTSSLVVIKKSKPFARNNNNIGSVKLWEVHKKNLFQGPLSSALWHFNKTFAKFAHSLALKLIQLFSKRKYNYQVRNNNHWGRSPSI